MRTLKVITEMANGATPTFVHIIMLSRAEVLYLAEHEVLMGQSLVEPVVVWLADDLDAETDMIHKRFEEMFARHGMPLETWHLGADEP